eukprot:gene13171-26738_t
MQTGEGGAYETQNQTHVHDGFGSTSPGLGEGGTEPCPYTFGGFQPMCPSYCNRYCSKCSERKTDEQSCYHGTCDKADCACNDGWQGDDCNKDVDECESGNNDCDHVCINTDGSFKCNCYDGYQLQGNKRSCKDVDECLAD